ncbi:MAG TPA: methylated DNA-protein cysteine methyltransferase [Pseudobacteroides sp.]|uniref:methylated DNA-protein cysteine methyltransferase n=1 Tax=Pseudobacteroides sp. TaxID=1968840 RepID=UPI002F92B365
MAKKTWNEKLRISNGLPKVEPIEEKMTKRLGVGSMVIPAPTEVDELMHTVEKGKLITTDIIREKLAKKHGATVTCPLTTGVFTKIEAFAAEENIIGGKTDVTPYWRTLKSKGELNEKFPGGTDNHKMLLEMEGHMVKQKGKKFS